MKILLLALLLLVGCETDDSTDSHEPDFDATQSTESPDNNGGDSGNEVAKSPPEIPDNPPELRADDDGIATFDGVHERLAPGRYLVLVRGGENCSPLRSEGLERAFREVARSSDPETPFVLVDRDEIHAFKANTWPVSAKFPELLLIEDGSIVDRHIGGEIWSNNENHKFNLKYVRHLLARNEILPNSPSNYTYDIRLEEREQRESQTIGPAEVSNQDLSSTRWVDSSFSGTQMQQVDFRDAELQNIVFSGVDMTGADFEGASLSEIDWYNTRCPDGSLSKTQSGSCRGGLMLSSD